MNCGNQQDSHSMASQELAYSLSARSRPITESQKSRRSSHEKTSRFSRKKSKESVQKFRSRVRSLQKTDQSICSTNKDQKQNKPSKQTILKKQTPIPKPLDDPYNLQHRHKQIQLSKAFQSSNPNTTKQNDFQSKQKSKSRLYKLKYMPMADILSYKGQPIRNQAMMERRLFNKIQLASGYY